VRVLVMARQAPVDESDAARNVQRVEEESGDGESEANVPQQVKFVESIGARPLICCS
jgi:hypothetical protein